MGRQSLTPVDVRRLLEVADEELRTAISLGHYAGLSYLEFTSLHWADLNFLEKSMKVGRGLGVPLKEVPMHPVLARQLMVLQGLRYTNGPEVFPAPQAVTRLREKLSHVSVPLGLGHVCFRDFQELFIELLKRASETAAVMGLLLGNKDAKSYVLFNKKGKLRDVDPQKYRAVLECFTDLLKQEGN